MKFSRIILAAILVFGMSLMTSCSKKKGTVTVKMEAVS